MIADGSVRFCLALFETQMLLICKLWVRVSGYTALRDNGATTFDDTTMATQVALFGKHRLKTTKEEERHQFLEDYADIYTTLWTDKTK